VHYTDIEKKTVATCLRFATSNTVRKQFYHYLLINGYVERERRGVYKITQKGEKLLEILG
jgi:predicted transcriptional regulator